MAYVPEKDLKDCEVCEKVRFKIGIPVFPDDLEGSPLVCSAGCAIRGKRIWVKREEPDEVEEMIEEAAVYGNATLPFSTQVGFVLQTSLIGW